MNVDVGLDAGLAGAAGVVLLLVLIVVQVFASSNTAKDHLKRASDLTGTRGAFAGRDARAEGEPSNDPASQQIFAQLTEYYAANINQSLAIFWASLLAMVAGFIIIVVGVATAGANSTNAIVAGIAGLLSQFIAATFLVALRSTQAQSTTYAQSLADLRARDLRAAADAKAIELGLALLNEIAADGASALANQTRAALAMGLIVKAPPAAEQAPAPSPPAPMPAPVPPAELVGGGDEAARSAAAGVRARVQSVAFDQIQAAGEQRGIER